jgi:AcrR family transcriptional regulator
MSSKAKGAIIEAFLNLTETEAFDKITVTQLVEECSISRQTFYYHFDDISTMLKKAFDEDTAVICATLESGRWQSAAKLFVPMLNKYDSFFRSALHSEKFLFVYGLVYSSFRSFIKAYFDMKKPADENEFLIDFCASGYAGLVFKEAQKEKSDYASLLSKLGNGFKVVKR